MCGSALRAGSASRRCFWPTAWAGSAPFGIRHGSPPCGGAVLLILGAFGLAVAIAVASPAIYVGGSVLAGLGVGLTFNGSLRAISVVTTAKSRSEVFSAVYVISYAALSLPSLAAGLAAPSWGLETTGYLYVGFVGALSVAAALHAGRSRAHRPTGDPMRTARESEPHGERTRC
jgi:hypothetical protein